MNDDDQLGVILFSEQGYTAKKLDFIASINRGSLSQQIMKIVELGGTNFESGFQQAVQLYHDCKTNINCDKNVNNEYENRILFLTDAMPNRGATEKGKLLDLVKNAANVNDDTGMSIYTTFIGIGIDFNTNLVEHISSIRGANYFCVNSKKDFIHQMANKQEFDCMVTPLIFDLKLSINLNNWDIEAIYGGNDSKDIKNEYQQIEGKIELMRVATYFATIQRKRKIKQLNQKQKEQEIVESKGGVTLIKLKKRGEKSSSDIDRNQVEGMDASDELKSNFNDTNNDVIEVNVSYQDRHNNVFTNSQSVAFEDKLMKIDNINHVWSTDDSYVNEVKFFSNTGIQKAVLLSEYVKLIHKWIAFESQQAKRYKLHVGDEWIEKFKTFQQHFKQEMKQIKDDSLEKEVKTLDWLINVSKVN